MQNMDVYQQIARRTGGDVYIGVVGPVRTGKSTFIRRFMDLMVLPGMEDSWKKERIYDGLPQSGSGRTIMTTQPQFVPEEAAEIHLPDETVFRMRMVDCVGYMAEDVLGATEENLPRMVRTPWHEEEIPFEQAAEEGTRRVIRDHSTMALVVTTDGTITSLPREKYVKAEARVVNELKALGKPFAVILNSIRPASADCRALQRQLAQTYDVPVVPLDVLHMEETDTQELLSHVLYEFPARCMQLETPEWMRELSRDHWLWQACAKTLKEAGAKFIHMRDYTQVMEAYTDGNDFEGLKLVRILPGEGKVEAKLLPAAGLYYRVLTETCGCEIRDEAQLMGMMNDLIYAKRQFDRMAGALEQVKSTGYGIISPSMEELTLEPPEMVRQGAQFGVRLRASAPSWHILRVDVTTEVSPAVGTEKQSEKLLAGMLETFRSDPESIWETEIFGRSLSELVKDGLSQKLVRMPEQAQRKLRDALARVVGDEGGGFMFIML